MKKKSTTELRLPLFLFLTCEWILLHLKTTEFIVAPFTYKNMFRIHRHTSISYSSLV